MEKFSKYKASLKRYLQKNTLQPNRMVEKHVESLKWLFNPKMVYLPTPTVARNKKLFDCVMYTLRFKALSILGIFREKYTER